MSEKREESDENNMLKEEKNEKIPRLDAEKAYEILMNVFEACNVKPPDDCHRHFSKTNQVTKEETRGEGQ